MDKKFDRQNVSGFIKLPIVFFLYMCYTIRVEKRKTKWKKTK